MACGESNSQVSKRDTDANRECFVPVKLCAPNANPHRLKAALKACMMLEREISRNGSIG